MYWVLTGYHVQTIINLRLGFPVQKGQLTVFVVIRKKNANALDPDQARHFVVHYLDPAR